MLITKLIKLHDVDESDFGFEPSEYAAMHNAWMAGANVAVLGVACEVDDVPEHNYYNVALANGTILTAVSGHHLSGIESWK